MFNRNARNRLNTMGGIRSLANGGLTQSRLNPSINYGGPSLGQVNPLAKTQFQSIGNINQGVLNQLISRNKTLPQIKSELQQQIKEPFINQFLPDPNVTPKTEGEAFTQSILTTLFPRFKKSPISPIDVSREKMKRLTPFGMQEKAKEALDAGIMTLPSNMLSKDPTKEGTVPFYKDKIFRDLEKTQDAEQKKIIKADQTDQTVAEEEKGITGDITRSDIITDEQKKQEQLDDEKRKQQGQLGDISPKSADEIAKVIKDGTKEEQDAELKQLMQEFTQNAPKYEGLDKGLAIAKIGFAMAAGQSPDALTNIAKALEGGADMFIKDKKERDSFNRQVRLSALQYGIGEISKDRAQDRLVSREIDKERRAIKYFVAGKGGVNYRGKTYAEGTDVPVRMADIYDNKAPNNIMSSSTVTALASKLKSSNALFKQAIKSGTLSATEIRTNQEKYSKAIKTAQQAEIGIGFAESALVRLAEDGSKVTGLNGAFRKFLKKGANALNMKLEGYDDAEELRKDFNVLLQKIIPATLGEAQSANSISNRDVEFLISAFFGDQALEGGALNTGYLFGDPKIMAKRVQAAMVEMRNSQKNAFAEMKDVELLLNNTYAPGSQGTQTAIKFLGAQQERAKELGVAPGQQAKTKFGLQSTGEKDDQGRMIFKIG